MTGPTRGSVRVVIIAALIVATTVLHYAVAVHAGPVHDLLARAYYIPVVLAGLWFGARGGFAAALGVTVVFLPHALSGWEAPYSVVYRLIEILMYHVIGVLTGTLSSRVARALAAERSARLDRERALGEKALAYEELKERTREVFDLERKVRRAERLAALGDLSAGLAHEIRNPLGSIKTAVEMLGDGLQSTGGSDPEKAEELVGIVLEETERLNRTLTAFLEFARSERGAGVDEPRRTHLGVAIEHTVGLLGTQLEQRAVDVRWEPSTLDVEVAVGASQLKQVLLNVLLNALDAVGKEGSITVELVERDRDELTVAVSDTGPGLPEELGERIFDPFVSGREGGTGLGLPVVARILDSNGGSIDVDRAHADGARFLITLAAAAV